MQTLFISKRACVSLSANSDSLGRPQLSEMKYNFKFLKSVLKQTYQRFVKKPSCLLKSTQPIGYLYLLIVRTQLYREENYW